MPNFLLGAIPADVWPPFIGAAVGSTLTGALAHMQTRSARKGDFHVACLAMYESAMGARLGLDKALQHERLLNPSEFALVREFADDWKAHRAVILRDVTHKQRELLVRDAKLVDINYRADQMQIKDDQDPTERESTVLQETEESLASACEMLADYAFTEPLQLRVKKWLAPGVHSD